MPKVYDFNLSLILNEVIQFIVGNPTNENFSRTFDLGIEWKVKHDVCRLQVTMDYVLIFEKDQESFDNLLTEVLGLFFTDEFSFVDKILKTTSVAIIENQVKIVPTLQNVVYFNYPL